MALTPEELVAISDLERAAIDDSSVVPEWLMPAEIRGSSAPISCIPYPQHTIDVFGGLLAGSWSLKFQNPLQRVVCDLEIYHGENARYQHHQIYQHYSLRFQVSIKRLSSAPQNGNGYRPG